MAERRMFAKSIVDSDAFLDMPMSTQCLYFHLSMRADDDGFLNNARKIQRMVGATDDDMKILLAKRFILPFESGVVVIKHWKIHNYIRNDRYKPTIYAEEKATLAIKENGAYTELLPVGIPSDNQPGYQMETQVRLGKVSIGKDNIHCLDDAEETKEANSEIYVSIISYLNDKLGTKFKPTTKKTKTAIHARLDEGFGLEDFKTVIDNKCADWLGNTKMEKYLRPETLFGPKFEGYLNERRNGNSGQGTRDHEAAPKIGNYI